MSLALYDTNLLARATKTNNFTNNDLVHRFNKQNLITLITNSKHSSLIFPFPFQLFSIDLNHLFILSFRPLNQFINITLKQIPLAISRHMGWPQRERGASHQGTHKSY